jgi:uncharacterized metal-binding protein YceD (DUF177 family)
MMHLHFEIKGKADAPCDRCGALTGISIDQGNDLLVRFAEENDFSDDEVIFVDASAHNLALDQFIYEFIIVGLPSRFVHPEGMCDPEVVRYFEADQKRNEADNNNDIDPRWEALKKLKS